MANKIVNAEKSAELAFQKAKVDAEKIWDLVSKELEEPEPLLSYRGNPMIFKNTIVLIQGKTGVHKSRLASSIVSLLVSNNKENSLLGFRNISSDHNLVIYCDTERNQNFQLPSVIKQIAIDANLNFDLLRESFEILPLTNTSRLLRTRVMGKQFAALKSSEKKHSVVILDIVSDFIADFNSVEDTLLLTDLINQAINTIDVTFFVIVHENPGSADKARGHLGTELANKASTVIQMSESDVKDVFKVKILKSRSTKKYDELLLKFDTIVNNLVVVTDNETQLRAGEPDLFRLSNALANKSFVTIERQELIGTLGQELKWGQRKIEAKLKIFIAQGIKIETPMGDAILQKTKGKKTEYQMVYLEPDQHLNDICKEEIEA